ncbi:MAG: hypothetical protein ABH882_03780 [Candidatus Omnitrophota bacterium]|nr:hypothetical protein [Candidatus Omnitrophota bacterium]MBU1928814.1 hypothetical protein [Candidatus Omnitrophota bacterium]MBU2035508.1 hypothetical protein [Candidatus Omnitrophota bacterium]MBU2222134.1 hypothetical protein [Candidatus Omnitrophota bacterium]MBU2257657.1 hypothetical protein [Candidatus Omnitrophota bacterium]
MDKKKIKRIIAREGLIIIGLVIVLYAILRFLPAIPVVFPKYQLEFINGETYTINIYPEILSGYNTKEIMKEALNPPPKLIEKRVKEFIDIARIKSELKESRFVNSNAVYRSELSTSFFGKVFIVKVFILYLILFPIRFIGWALRTLLRKE